MGEKSAAPNLLGLTTQIMSAYAGGQSIDASELPAAIRNVHRTLAALQGIQPVAAQASAPAPAQAPAVPVEASVFPDYIVCLEDGKQLKMLKRHLAAAYNMTPEQYRRKWGLDAQYPMVAPNYAERRSSLAKQIGLGTRKATAD